MLVRSKLSTLHAAHKVVLQPLDISLHKLRDFAEGKAPHQSQIGFNPSSRLGLGAGALQEAAPAGRVGNVWKQTKTPTFPSIMSRHGFSSCKPRMM